MIMVWWYMRLGKFGVDKLSFLSKYNLMRVVYFRLEGGRCPFEDWVDKLERKNQIAVMTTLIVWPVVAVIRREITW